MSRVKTVSFEGFKELKDKLFKLAEDIQRKIVHTTIKSALEPVLAEAKAKAPVGKGSHVFREKTYPAGALRDSYKMLIEEQKFLTEGTVGSDVPYALFVEKGHAVWVRAGGSRAVKKGYYKGKTKLSMKKSKHHVPAQPHLKPAMTKNVKKILGIIAQDVKNEIERHSET